MGIEISGSDGPVLGIYSSLDMFEKLKFESQRLKQDWHPYNIFNFLVTAWHLFQDWPKSDKHNDLNRLKRDRKNLPQEMNLVIDVIRDLVNGSKHFLLNQRSAEKRRVEETHTGDKVGFYEYFFHEDLPGVTVDKCWYFSIRLLNNFVNRYFEWVFDDSIPVKQFPDELTEAILYCNIPNRKDGLPPKIWLQNI